MGKGTALPKNANKTANKSAVPAIPAFRHLPAVAVVSVVFALGYRFFAFISAYSVNVLFWDQWDYLKQFFAGSATLVELFRKEHAPHREGVGILADKFLFSLTSWNVRAESFMIGGCVFTAMLLALLLKKKLFGQLAYSDVSIPFMFLTLAQYETLIGTPNPAYSAFPLLLLMSYCLALLQQNYVLKYGLVLAINFLLIYTGFGLFMGVVTIGLFALECYWRIRHMIPVPLALPGAALVIAAASLASFFLGYKFDAAVACFDFPRHDVGVYPWFMALMFSNFVGLSGPLSLATAAGAAILAFAAAVLMIQMRRLGQGVRSLDIALIPSVLLGYVMLFTAFTAVGRVCLGIPGGAQPSRYTTFLIPAFLAMYFYLLSIPPAPLRRIALGLFVILLVPNSLRVSPDVHWFADGKRAWAACYLQTEDIGHCDQVTHFPIYPKPEETDLKQKLEYLKERHLNLFADAVAK